MRVQVVGVAVVAALSGCAYPEYGVDVALDPRDAGLDSQPDGCALGAEPDPDLVNSCVLAVSCDPRAPEQSISDCITRAALPAPCLANAVDCSDVSACTGVQREAPCDGDASWICADQSKAIRCLVSTEAYSVDCALLGGSCDLYAASDGPEPPCRLPVPATCSQNTGTHCSGDYRYTCLDGIAYGLDCAALSLQCREDAAGEARCVPAGPPCSAPDTVTCSDESIQICESWSRIVAFDCGRAGGRCEASDAGTAHCLAPSCSAEDLASCQEACGATAGTLRLCVGGAPYDFDCRTVGLDECVPYQGRFVRCR